MSKYCVDIVTKSGKDIFYYVSSDKDLHKLFRQRMSDKENCLLGLKSANGGKILIDCSQIAAVLINEEHATVADFAGSEDANRY